MKVTLTRAVLQVFFSSAYIRAADSIDSGTTFKITTANRDIMDKLTDPIRPDGSSKKSARKKAALRETHSALRKVRRPLSCLATMGFGFAPLFWSTRCQVAAGPRCLYVPLLKQGRLMRSKGTQGECNFTAAVSIKVFLRPKTCNQVQTDPLPSIRGRFRRDSYVRLIANRNSRVVFESPLLLGNADNSPLAPQPEQ